MYIYIYTLGKIYIYIEREKIGKFLSFLSCQGHSVVRVVYNRTKVGENPGWEGKISPSASVNSEQLTREAWTPLCTDTADVGLHASSPLL